LALAAVTAVEDVDVAVAGAAEAASLRRRNGSQ